MLFQTPYLLTPSAKNLSWVIATSLESNFWRNKEHSKLITFLYLFLPKIVPRSKFAGPTFLIISAPKFCVKSNNILQFIFFYLSKPFLPRNVFTSQRANPFWSPLRAVRLWQVKKTIWQKMPEFVAGISTQTAYFVELTCVQNFHEKLTILCYPRYTCAIT